MKALAAAVALGGYLVYRQLAYERMTRAWARELAEEQERAWKAQTRELKKWLRETNRVIEQALRRSA